MFHNWVIKCINENGYLLYFPTCGLPTFKGMHTARPCLHDTDEGPIAGLLYSACSDANWTSLKQLQQAIL
jgi:hypothetical protein